MEIPENLSFGRRRLNSHPVAARRAAVRGFVLSGLLLLTACATPPDRATGEPEGGTDNTPARAEPASADAFTAEVCQLVRSAAALKSRLSGQEEAPSAAITDEGAALANLAADLRGRLPDDHTQAVEGGLRALSKFERRDLERRSNVIRFADRAGDMGRSIPCNES